MGIYKKYLTKGFAIEIILKILLLKFIRCKGTSSTLNLLASWGNWTFMAFSGDFKVVFLSLFPDFHSFPWHVIKLAKPTSKRGQARLSSCNLIYQLHQLVSHVLKEDWGGVCDCIIYIVIAFGAICMTNWEIVICAV